jgi:hypothetical protein
MEQEARLIKHFFVYVCMYDVLCYGAIVVTEDNLEGNKIDRG